MAISRLIHCGSHDPWLSVLKRVAKSTELLPEEELSCKREIGNAHDTHALPLAVRNIIDEDIKTSGRVPRG